MEHGLRRHAQTWCGQARIRHTGQGHGCLSTGTARRTRPGPQYLASVAVIWTEVIKLVVCVGAQGRECYKTAAERGHTVSQSARHQASEILGQSYPMLLPAGLFVMQQASPALHQSCQAGCQAVAAMLQRQRACVPRISARTAACPAPIPRLLSRARLPHAATQSAERSKPPPRGWPQP